MKKSKRFLIVFVFMAAVLLLSACGSQVSGAGNTEGTITISGAFALYPIMVRWGEEYQAIYPNVRIDISAGGAGKGMADALSGAVDIGMVSREIHPEEIDLGAYGIAVTKDAVFLTINENNPVLDDLRQKGITREILVGIFISGEITTWGQVVGRPEVTDPIHVFTRSDACGAADTWAAYLGGKQEDLLGIGVYGDPGVLDAVIKDPSGIGYNNLNYAYDFESGLPVTGARVVSLDANANGLADPDEIYDTKALAISAVSTGKYPAPPARELYVVTNGQPTGLTAAFIEWILNDGQQYINETGYIALPADRLAEEVQKLK
ncbi:MAG TPA: phosphate ABC transporter substrate-binding protein [Chloroflexi bacterium]|nr:phosphate ABC transporter substrate-binding protein [Chloroflexota bacterium]